MMTSALSTMWSLFLFCFCFLVCLTTRLKINKCFTGFNQLKFVLGGVNIAVEVTSFILLLVSLFKLLGAIRRKKRSAESWPQQATEHDSSVRVRGIILLPVLIRKSGPATSNHVISFLPCVDYREGELRHCDSSRFWSF